MGDGDGGRGNVSAGGTGGAGGAGRGPASARASAAAAKWNARYRFSGDAVPPPAGVLSRHERLLPAPTGAAAPGARRSRALDLACGRAGNAERLGALGFEAHAWDVSEAVIEALGTRPGSRIHEALARDAVADPPAPESFEVVVVARFLERSICPAIARALVPGGTLLYETFTAGLAERAFLLEPNELLALFPTLDVLAYREPPPDARGRATAMLAARRPV